MELETLMGRLDIISQKLDTIITKLDKIERNTRETENTIAGVYMNTQGLPHIQDELRIIKSTLNNR